MRILIDTRETKPLQFLDYPVTDTIRQKLDVGDYGCAFKDGYIVPVVFERKGLGDLFGTMGKGYKRFKKELERGKASNIKVLLIVEGSLSKVLAGYSHSGIEGVSVVRKLFTLWIRYGLYPIFCKNREEMSRYIIEYYSAIGRNRLKEKKRVVVPFQEGC